MIETMLRRLPPIWREAIDELWRRRLRTLLTLLGLIFGVGAIVAMQAVGEGSRREALRLVESLGLHNLIAEAKPQDEDTLKETRARSLGLSVADARAALAVVPGAEKYAAEKPLKTHSVFSDYGSGDAQASGVSADWFALSSLKVARGRALTAQDDEALAPVAVWQRRGPQEVSAIHEMRDGGHRRRHGAFLMNVGNQGWEWAGPSLSVLAGGYVEAGLSGADLLGAVRFHASREMTLVALTEQLPDPDNRITPDFDRLDAIGVPKPRVFFRLDRYTENALAAARKIHEQLFAALGASEIGHLPYAEGAGHIMGTTRMGADGRTSVANASGRSHDHSNLWFAGSSLFPTSATANPTLTIAALALRTAAAIKAAMRR